MGRSICFGDHGDGGGHRVEDRSHCPLSSPGWMMRVFPCKGLVDGGVQNVFWCTSLESYGRRGGEIPLLKGVCDVSRTAVARC